MVDRRRPFRAVTGNQVITDRWGGGGLHGANSDRIRIVAGRCDGAITLVVKRVVAAKIPGRESIRGFVFKDGAAVLGDHLKDVSPNLTMVFDD